MVWMVTWAVPLHEGILNVISRILLLALLVIVPLGWQLMEQVEENGRFAPYYSPFTLLAGLAGIAGLVSLLMPVGVTAGFLAIGWVIVASCMALFGMLQAVSRGWQQSLPKLCLDVALVYLLVGSLWFVASRLGLSFLGFLEPIVLLTAVHFHYAGFATAILTGFAGLKLQEVGKRPFLYDVGASGALLAVPLTAVGILASPIVEIAAVVILVISLYTLGYVIITQVAPHLQSKLSRWLLCGSWGFLMVTMLLAVGYAIGEFTSVVQLSVPQMAQFHGWANSLGFAACGMVAWAIEQRNTGPIS